MKKIRYILTRECPFNCVFCHKDNISYSGSKQHLNAQDYGFFTSVAKNCGINEFVLSGGEPLSRKDINEIISEIANNKIKLQITTNGVLLNKIKSFSNVSKINVSVHSLNLKIHEKITRTKFTLPKVLDGLNIDAPTTKIKVNIVALKNVTTDEKNLKQILDFCSEKHFTPKIIELYDESSPLFISVSEIIPIISKLGFSKYKKCRGGTIYKNGVMQLIIQKCLCHHIKEFDNADTVCNEINDLFITPDGKINYCRELNKTIDAYEAVKHKDSDKLRSLIIEAGKLMGQSCPYKKSNT